MYCHFFGLKADPFSPISLTACDYPNACFQLNLQRLTEQVAQITGITLLVGPTGVGKSSLIKRVSDNVESQHPNIWLRDLTSFGQFSVTAPNHAVKALEIESRARTPSLKASQDKTLFLLDHADSASDNFLARFLSVVSQRNAAAKPTLLILIGLPDLESRLEQPRFCPYKSELRETLLLNRLDFSETKDYILHRLRSVEFSGEMFFTDNAIHQIAEFSNGIPRRINKLCGSSLLLASLEENPVISEDAIQNAAKICFLEKDDSRNLVSSESAALGRPTETSVAIDKQPGKASEESLKSIVQNLNSSTPGDETVDSTDDSITTLETQTQRTAKTALDTRVSSADSSVSEVPYEQEHLPNLPKRPISALAVPQPAAITNESRPILKPILDFDVAIPRYSNTGNKFTDYILKCCIVSLLILLSIKGFGWISRPGLVESSGQTNGSVETENNMRGAETINDSALFVTSNAAINAGLTEKQNIIIEARNKPMDIKPPRTIDGTEPSNNKANSYSFQPIQLSKASSTAGFDPSFIPTMDRSASAILLAEANIQLAKNRLSIPKGDNAFETYQRVLEQEPGNQAAMRGLGRIQRIFANKAKKAIARKAWHAADKALETAIRLNPNDIGLVTSQADVRENLRPPATSVE